VALSLAVAPALTACNAPVGSTAVRDVAWVTTGGSVTLPGMDVTPVDLSTRRPGAQVPVGSLPSALAYTAGDRGLLVVTKGDDTLAEIDPATHDVIHAVKVGVEPVAVAVAPGGAHGQGIALVANFDSNTVTPVDLGTWRAGPPIAVGSEPVALAVAPPIPGSGTVLAFVANFGSNTVTPINLASMGTGAPIPVGPGPQALALASGALLVGNFGNATLTQIDAATLRPDAPVPLPFAPTGIAAGPAATAYVCGGAGLVPVTPTTLGPTVGTPIGLPDVAQGVALSSDGATAWVTQQAGGLIPVTLANGKTGPVVHLGGHPSAIVIGAG
jgi:DNA-binding beta-propeller fold protein YncE